MTKDKNMKGGRTVSEYQSGTLNGVQNTDIKCLERKSIAT